MVSVFDRIYEGNVWNGAESRSGPGSGTAATTRLRESLRVVLGLIMPTSVLDVGCGDGFWMPTLREYVGVDVSQRAVDLHRARHPGRDVRLDDGGPLPRAHLIITRDVMQHLSLEDGLALLTRIFVAEPRWIIASTYLDGRNEDITPDQQLRGYGYRIDLTAFPFAMPPPPLVIPDGWGWEDPNERRDPGKVLGIWHRP